VDITLPAELWEGVPADAQALVDAWLVDPGAHVQEGEIVARVILAKSTLDVAAPAAGMLDRILVAAGSSFARGQAIGTMRRC